MLHQWFVFDWRFSFVVLGLIGLFFPVFLSGYVLWATGDRRFDKLADVPVENVAIIFGAGVWEDGSPTPMLAQRVQAGVDLYLMGKVEKLLMSGDHSSEDYNEVRAMAEYAENRGVPVDDIILDPAGFSTYESCYRARDVFAVKRAILVTQRYHLPRAVYTCNRLGIDAVGLGTPDWGVFRYDSMFRYSLREFFAIVKALWQIYVSQPKRILDSFDKQG